MPRVLLIEADRLLAKNTANLLTSHGHKVISHSNLQNAILSADKSHPDIVILDLMLAEHSGTEFLYELRSYPEWQNIPVIVTGQLSDEELETYQPAFAQLNITSYLNKHTTSVHDMAAEIQKILQPVKV